MTAPQGAEVDRQLKSGEPGKLNDGAKLGAVAKVGDAQTLSATTFGLMINERQPLLGTSHPGTAVDLSGVDALYAPKARSTDGYTQVAELKGKAGSLPDFLFFNPPEKSIATGRDQPVKLDQPAKLEPPSGLEAERTKLLGRVDTLLPPEKATQFKAWESEFEKRVKGNLSDTAVAGTLTQIDRMLEPSTSAPISNTDRVNLAYQVMHHAAHPEAIAQGQQDTCTVNAVEKRMYRYDPAVAAKVVADLSLTGKYTDARGTSVKVDTTPHLESTKPIEDGKRTWASELYQVAAVNLWYAHDPKHQDIRYIQTADGEELTKPLKNGGREVTAHTPGFDDSGAEGAIYNYMTGRHDKGFVLANEKAVQPPTRPESAEVLRTYKTEQELGDILKEMNAKHLGSAILGVNLFNEPFYTDDGMPHNGGYHDVNALDYSEQPGQKPKVFIDNNWGVKFNKTMSLTDVFLTTAHPAATLADMQAAVAADRANGTPNLSREENLLRLERYTAQISDDQWETQAKQLMIDTAARWKSAQDNGHPLDPDSIKADREAIERLLRDLPSGADMKVLKTAQPLIAPEQWWNDAVQAGWKMMVADHAGRSGDMTAAKKIFEQLKSEMSQGDREALESSLRAAARMNFK